MHICTYAQIPFPFARILARDMTLNPNASGGSFMKHVLIGLTWLSLFPLISCQKATEIRSDIYDLRRRNMVRWDLEAKGINSKRVLDAVRQVPRHLFLLPQHRNQAYTDVDLPIAPLISTPRPYVVAKTIELLNLKGPEIVLEVGTGLGYQSALLGELAKEVYTIEIVPDVGRKAEEMLQNLNYKNVHCMIGDGFKGWPEHQPFDAILVTASVKTVPAPLIEQLKLGGRLVIPIEELKEGTKLCLYVKTPSGLKKETVMDVDLQPMEGRATGRFWYSTREALRGSSFHPDMRAFHGVCGAEGIAFWRRGQHSPHRSTSQPEFSRNS